MIAQSVLPIAASYLLGSIPIAYLAGHWMLGLYIPASRQHSHASMRPHCRAGLCCTLPGR
jgi:hypothetical protein